MSLIGTIINYLSEHIDTALKTWNYGAYFVRSDMELMTWNCRHGINPHTVSICHFRRMAKNQLHAGCHNSNFINLIIKYHRVLWGYR